MNYKIKNFSNYSNKKYSKFTSNFVDDRDFSNFMRGIDKGELDKGDWAKDFTVFNLKSTNFHLKGVGFWVSTFKER